MEIGLWVEAQSPLSPWEADRSLRKVVTRAKNLRVTDLYLQVCRGGRTWFPSSVGDDSPYQMGRLNNSGTIEKLFEFARMASMRVHAWINVFNLGAAPSPKVLGNFGPNEFLKDSAGRCVTEYGAQGMMSGGDSADSASLDTPGVWLNPASGVVKDFICKLIQDLLINCPDLAGIHLDFFRYPYLLPLKVSSWSKGGLEFGYSAASLERFAKDTGLQNPFIRDERNVVCPSSYETALSWDAWRREGIDRYLRELGELVRPARSLSVAVLPWSDRAYLNAFQNWRMWLEEALLDKAALMSYTADGEHFRQMVMQACAFRRSRSKVLAGIGCYRLSTPAQVKAQIQCAADTAADGVVLFSYAAIMDREPTFYAKLADLMQDLNQ